MHVYAEALRTKAGPVTSSGSRLLKLFFSQENVSGMFGFCQLENDKKGLRGSLLSA